MRSIFILVSVLFCAALPGWATLADPFQESLIQQVQTRHDLGVKGDKKAVETLVADLEKWTKEQPDNQLLRAYLGSAYTLRSRDVFPGPSKLRFLKTGLQTMDAAVEAAPGDVAVRFIRAVNNIQLPAFFNRRDTARADFQILIATVSDPNFQTSLSVETMQAIHFYAGLSFKQLHEPAKARSVWISGLDLAPQTVLGLKIQTALRELKS